VAMIVSPIEHCWSSCPQSTPRSTHTPHGHGAEQSGRAMLLGLPWHAPMMAMYTGNIRTPITGIQTIMYHVRWNIFLYCWNNYFSLKKYSVLKNILKKIIQVRSCFENFIVRNTVVQSDFDLENMTVCCQLHV
jgi:hypothetical protein